MTIRALLPALLLCSARFAGAQPSEAPGEVVQLSPFEISTDEDWGYREKISAGSLSRYVNPAQNTGPLLPTAPITLVRRADAVVIQFALSNSSDKQEGRNKQLSTSIESISAAIKTAPGL